MIVREVRGFRLKLSDRDMMVCCVDRSRDEVWLTDPPGTKAIIGFKVNNIADYNVGDMVMVTI